MRTVNVQEAKTHFSRLLRQVEAGEEIAIARAGKVIARLVRDGSGAGPRFGVFEGQVVVHPDALAPMGSDEADAWDGGSLFPALDAEELGEKR